LEGSARPDGAPEGGSRPAGNRRNDDASRGRLSTPSDLTPPVGRVHTEEEVGVAAVGDEVVDGVREEGEAVVEDEHLPTPGGKGYGRAGPAAAD